MKQIKLSAKKLKNIMNSYLGLVDAIEDEEVRKGIHRLLDSIGERFMEAPASNRLEYHNCFVGGLVEHSVRVYATLRELRNTFAPDLTDDSIAVVALMHDIGKLGSVEQQYYLPQDSEWHQNKLGEYYIHNPELEYLGTAQRSLRLLSQFNVPLTDLEYKAILIHDGQYIEANKPYQHREGMLGLLLHQADMLACKMEKEKWEKVQ